VCTVYVCVNVWYRYIVIDDMFYVQGNTDTEAAEYNREQTECERVKEELQKKYEGALSTTSLLETEVEQLRQTYTEKSEVHLISTQ